MRLRDCIDESVVRIGLESIDKDECFEEMIDILVRAGRVSDRTEALRAIKEREEQGSTGIGRAFAVPHGKSSSVTGLTVALGTSAEGVEFDSDDGKPVRLVCLILAPVGDPGLHIQALAEVMRLIRMPGFIEKLAKAESAKALLDILDAEE